MLATLYLPRKVHDVVPHSTLEVLKLIPLQSLRCYHSAWSVEAFNIYMALNCTRRSLPALSKVSVLNLSNIAIG